MSELEVLTVLYPPALVLAAAALVLVLPRAAGTAAGVLSLLGVLAIAAVAPAGGHLAGTFLGFEVQPFLIDPFTRVVAGALAFLGAAAVLYAHSSRASRSLTAIALAYVGSSIGAAVAGGWLSVLFMWEIMALTSTVLIWQYGGEAVRAGYRYAIAHGTAGALFLLAVGWHYAEVGTFAYGAGGVEGIAPGGPMLLAALGIGINVAFVGLHTWLPDSYPRPHFAASVFLAVYTTKTSAYVLYRAFPDGNLLLAYMGGLMAVYGVVFALLQHDMRALLTYHIQAQLGYIVAGIGMGTAIGLAGAMGHLVNNVLFKSLLFMAVGVVIFRTGENDLYRLGGLWRSMPLTAIAFAVGALSITAVPGFNGFVSKGMLLDAAGGYFGGPEYRALYWLLVLGAIGTLLSFIKLGYYVFLHGSYGGEIRDAAPGQTVAMFAVGAACIALGLAWQPFVGALPAVDGTAVAVAGSDHGLHPYSPGHLTDTLALVAVAVVGFVAIRKPLSRLEIPDPAFLVHPLGFHVGRVSMLAVTETFARADSLAVGVVRRAYWLGNNPAVAVDRVAGRLPEWGSGRHSPDGGRTGTRHLRLGIGTSVLVVTVVLTVVLLVVL